MDIVICTANNIRNKNGSIYFSIRSILAQTFTPVQIFVSINAEYRSTKKFIQQSFGKLVTVVDSTAKPHNISFTRNNAARLGSSDYILFMDDDVVIGKNNFVELVVQKLKTEQFCCGAKRFWAHPGWHNYLDKGDTINHTRSILAHKSFLPKSIDRLSGKLAYHDFSFIGHFGAIRRNVFNEIGGYDEKYHGWSYQDTDLMMRLCYMGYNFELLSNDGIFVYHLSHEVDKSKTFKENKSKYLLKQKKLGIKFHLNHFFGVFNDDSYSLITKI